MVDRDAILWMTIDYCAIIMYVNKFISFRNTVISSSKIFYLNAHSACRCLNHTKTNHVTVIAPLIPQTLLLSATFHYDITIPIPSNVQSREIFNFTSQLKNGQLKKNFLIFFPLSGYFLRHNWKTGKLKQNFWLFFTFRLFASIAFAWIFCLEKECARIFKWGIVGKVISL